MTPVAQPIPFAGGIDRSVIPLRANDGTFWDLLNMRQSSNQQGLLEQTPFFATETLTRLSYNIGAGSTQESASGSVRLINRSILVTDGTVRMYNLAMTGGYNTIIPVFHQITVPAADGLTKGCRISITNVQSITGSWVLGSDLEVEIDGATTFKWRINGGAYTTLVPITTTGVSVGGILFFWFLTSTGFTVGDRWVWKRTDAANYNIGGTSSVIQNPMTYANNKSKLYFTAYDQRIMLFDIDHVVTVGYRPVYGSALAFFDDHLIITDYSTTATAAAATTRACIIGSSDKTDYHTFFATDVNEADTYTLPNNVREDFILEASPNQQLTRCIGAFVLLERLFIVTTKEIYHTSALGLPIVFSFTKFCDFAGITSVVIADKGVYLITANPNDIVFFDGASFKPIGHKLGDAVSTRYSGATFIGGYNEHAHEFLLHDSGKGRIFVYQERTDTWYSRSASFVTAVTCLYGTGPYALEASEVFIGGASLLYGRDALISAQPSYDASSGTAYATPKVTTHLFGNNLRIAKEISDTYLGYNNDSTASSTYYSTGANVQFKLFWYLSLDGRITGSPTTDAAAVLVSSSANGTFGGYPRTAFRAIALEIQVNGLVSAKPPMQALITAIEPVISDPTPRTPTR